MAPMNCCERDPQMLEHKHPYSAASDLRDVIAIMRDARALRVKMPSGLEVELSPLAFAVSPVGAEPAELAQAAPAPIGVEHGGEPTEEQILMWSAGGALPAAQQPEAT